MTINFYMNTNILWFS